MELKSLMVNIKTAWIDFPGIDNFCVEVANLSRPELTKLRKACVTKQFDRKTKLIDEVLDEDLFVKKFSEAVIRNWKGLNLESLQSLMLVELGEHDPTTELPYSTENAELLLSSSNEFDTWLNEVVFDLDNFRS